MLPSYWRGATAGVPSRSPIPLASRTGPLALPAKTASALFPVSGSLARWWRRNADSLMRMRRVCSRSATFSPNQASSHGSGAAEGVGIKADRRASISSAPYTLYPFKSLRAFGIRPAFSARRSHASERPSSLAASLTFCNFIFPLPLRKIWFTLRIHPHYGQAHLDDCGKKAGIWTKVQARGKLRSSCAN